MNAMHVLIVDEDVSFVRDAMAALKPIAVVQSLIPGEHMREAVSQHHPDVVVLGLLLTTVDSFALLDDLARPDPGSLSPVVLCMTAGRGARTYLPGPYTWPIGTVNREATPEQLRAAVRRAVAVRSAMLAEMDPCRYAGAPAPALGLPARQ